MEEKMHGAKKNSLHALHKLMKDLHHKAMSEPKEAAVEVHVESMPDDSGEHDEENVGKGVSPFDSSDMEDQEQAKEVGGEHPSDATLPESDEEEHSAPEMHLPDGIKEMLKNHLKSKK